MDDLLGSATFGSASMTWLHSFAAEAYSAFRLAILASSTRVSSVLGLFVPLQNLWRELLQRDHAFACGNPISRWILPAPSRSAQLVPARSGSSASAKRPFVWRACPRLQWASGWRRSMRVASRKDLIASSVSPAYMMSVPSP